MIPLLVFFIHVVFVAALFTKKWQEEGISGGVLAVLFVGLIFFVGWSITSFLVRLAMPEEVVLGLSRDSASLLLLTGLEVVFYRFYLGDDKKEPGSGKATGGQS